MPSISGTYQYVVPGTPTAAASTLNQSLLGYPGMPRVADGSNATGKEKQGVLTACKAPLPGEVGDQTPQVEAALKPCGGPVAGSSLKQATVAGLNPNAGSAVADSAGAAPVPVHTPSAGLVVGCNLSQAPMAPPFPNAPPTAGCIASAPNPPADEKQAGDTEPNTLNANATGVTTPKATPAGNNATPVRSRSGSRGTAAGSRGKATAAGENPNSPATQTAKTAAASKTKAASTKKSGKSSADSDKSAKSTPIRPEGAQTDKSRKRTLEFDGECDNTESDTSSETGQRSSGHSKTAVAGPLWPHDYRYAAFS